MLAYKTVVMWSSAKNAVLLVLLLAEAKRGKESACKTGDPGSIPGSGR